MFKQNLKYRKCVDTKMKIFEGLFINKPCLIYILGKDTLSSIAEYYRKLKQAKLVNILFEGRDFHKTVLVTEITSQYPFYLKEQSSRYHIFSKIFCFPLLTVRKFANFIKNRLSNKKIDESCLHNHSTNYLQKTNYNVQKISLHEFRKQLYEYVLNIENLHSDKLVHGKLCPENIRITAQKELKVQYIFNNNGWRSQSQLKNIKNPEYEPTVQDDIFSFGCVMHYYLTGFHPFDLNELYKPPKKQSASSPNLYQESKFDSEEDSNSIEKKNINSIKNGFNKYTNENEIIFKKIIPECRINYIENNILFRSYCIRIADQVEHDLIYHCLFKGDFKISKHPYFWSYEKRIEFICDFSDFLETNIIHKKKLDKFGNLVFDKEWIKYFDPIVVEIVHNRRMYDVESLSELVRLIRNLQRHYHELKIKSFFAKYEGNLCGYFLGLFPNLFMILYKNKTIRYSNDFEKYF